MKLRKSAILVGAALAVALAVAGCSGGDDPPPAGGNTIPSHTLQAQTGSGCPTQVAADGSLTVPATCHLHIVFTQTYPQNRVRVQVDGQFLASEVYPLIFATNTAASDGWVLQFFRSGSSLFFDACDTEACTGGSQVTGTYSGTFNNGDNFRIWGDVDRTSTPNSIRGWADTDPATAPAGDISGTGTPTGLGNLVGVSVRGAKITGVTVTTP